MIGVMRRLKRFFTAPSKRAFVLTLDHGASDGMLPGLMHMTTLLEAIGQPPAQGLVQGVVLNRGMARAYATKVDPAVQVVVQLSAGTKHGLPTYMKSLVCSAAEALRVGADAVCIHMNIGNDLEDRMLTDFGSACEDAHQLGLPVMAVIYPRGGQIVNERDPSLIGHAIRVGGELGADLVCAPMPLDPRSFADAVESCPAPVLVAGGAARSDFEQFLVELNVALECGVMGACVGRNIFQHPDPIRALGLVAAVVHGPEALRGMTATEPEPTST
ncbi:class I fructose-bisphosphate aldolase [Megalodesulfovibrio paquesii]